VTDPIEKAAREMVYWRGTRNRNLTSYHMNSTDNQVDLEAAIIGAYDAYMKATQNREMTDKEIALVLRPVSSILSQLDR